MAEIALNKQQKEAVEHEKGPLLIIAGAGTGKTRVITERIVRLLDKKLATPKEILALTFTQKAAQEMEERVDVAMPYGYEEIWISTFHSFCDKILKQEGIYIGIDPSYSLMTQAQEYIFFRSMLFELPINRFRPKGNPTKFIGEILGYFSRLGDEDVDPKTHSKFVKDPSGRSAELSRSPGSGLDGEAKKDYEELAKVYKQYHEAKLKQSKLGFSDLVPLTLKLFREKPEVLKKYKKQFKYILVDEFQDTNYAQNELVKLLAGKNGNIAVVGDDDQAIYKFRGAAVSNIMDFKKTFPKAKKVVLTHNYRSNQKVLDLAYKLIKKNDPDRLEVTEKVDKKLVASNPKYQEFDNQALEIDESQIGMPFAELSDPIRRIHANTDVEESEAIAQEIEKLVKDGPNEYSYRDIAVLVRANSHSDQVVQSLRYHNIPFTFPGPKGLYNRSEIKDMIAFLKVVADYDDDISMYRLLTLENNGLEVREFMDLQKLSRKKRISLFSLIETLLDRKVGSSKSSEQGDIPDEEQYYSNGMYDLAKIKDKMLSKEAQQWLNKLFDVFENAFAMVKNRKSVGEVLYSFAMDSGYIDSLVTNESVKNEWKIQNISKFFDILKRFEKETDDPSVYQFLDYLEYSLEIGENPSTDVMDLEDVNAVNILTVHGAKGLEFPVVFMIDLVSDRFPTRNRRDVIPVPEKLIKETLPKGDEHIQEERRLFYVGLTRAKDIIYLCSADYYGDGVRKKKQSVLLHDVDLVEEEINVEQAVKKEDPLGTYKGDVPDDAEVPEDIRKAFVKNLERNLNYSQISSFENCPYQFYFKYVLQIPGSESHARSFGLTVHNTLKEFYERLRISKQGLSKMSKPPTQTDLLEIYKNKWQSGGYENPKQEEDRYRAGEEALKNFYKEFYDKSQDPILLEHRFRVPMGDFWLKGTIDRVDVTDKGLEIIDYKTGSVPKDPKHIEKDLQLPTYALALEKIQDKKLYQVSLLYVQEGVKVSTKISKKDKAKSIEAITKSLDEIKELKFPPKPGPLCKFCDYKNICNYAMID